MPFSLTAVVGTATYSLTAGTPFWLEGGEGLGMATVRRLTEQAPFGDGDTDLGYRLNARYVTLSLSYSGTSGSVVDGYRNTLAQIFKPSSTVPVQLRVVRDDGGTRQLDCYTVGQVDVPLDYEYVPGNLQRTVVQLKAADPAWYNPTAGSVTVTGTAGLVSNWYLVGGLISPDEVLEYGTFPSDSQAWTYSGTPSNNVQIVIRTARGTVGSPFKAGNMSLYASGGNYYAPKALGGSQTLGTGLFPSAGTHNYLYDAYAYFPKTPKQLFRSARDTYSGAFWWDDNAGNVFAGTDTSARQWRVGWVPDIRLYAIYSTSKFRNGGSRMTDALWQAMDNADGSVVATSVNVAYQGNVPEYPIVTIRGPIENPVVTNLVTGDTLTFSSVTLSASTTYTIDLRYGNKRVYDQGGTSRLDQLSSDSDLATFALQPAPLAAGGTNVLMVSGNGLGTATQVTVTYYNRYSEY